MKKIFLFLLLASTLFLSGCILFPPQEEQKLIEPEKEAKISLKEIPVNDFLRANIDPLILSNGKKAITLFNKEIYLVDLEAEAIIKSIKLDKPIFSGTDAVLTSDESLLLVPAMDELLLINVNDFSIDSVFPLKGVIVDDVDVIVSKNNSTAFVSTNSVNSSAVTFIDLIGKKKLKELEINGKLQHGNDLVLSKDGKLAVQPTLRGASLIDLENNSLIKEFEFNSLAKPDVDAVFLSDSKTVLIPSRNSLNAIDALTQTMTSIPFKGNLITGVDLQLTQDESLALLPTYEGLQLFDLESKQLLSTIPLTGKIRQNIDLLLIDSKALMPSNKYLHFIDLKTGSISNILSFKEDLMEGVDLLLSEDNKTAFLPLLGRLYEIDVENEKITGSISSLNALRIDSDLIHSTASRTAVLSTFKSIVLIKNIPENSLLLAKEKSIDVFDLNEKKLIQSFALTQPTLWGSDLVNNSLQSRNSFDEDIALNADELVEYADDSGRRFNSRRPPQTVPPITVPPTANPPGMPPITQPPDFNAPPSYPIPDELNGIFFQKVSGNQILVFNHDANILFELEFPFSIIQMIFDNQNKKIKTRLSNNSISIIDLSPLPLNPPTQINIPRNVLGASPSEMELFDPNNNLLIEYLSNGDILLI
ncbi:MAG TPA: hypothetical protein VJK05_04840, partial [archaeon]|nr:hypothetical protein [archaeon]